MGISEVPQTGVATRALVGGACRPPGSELRCKGAGAAMKISTILDHIDSGHMALPEFQRGYVWNRDQVRDLVDSLYKRHPVGGLLVWVTESKGAPKRATARWRPEW